MKLKQLNGFYEFADFRLDGENRCDTTFHFTKWLEAEKLNVEKIIAFHGTVSTMKELLTAVAKKEKTQK